MIFNKGLAYVTLESDSDLNKALEKN